MLFLNKDFPKSLKGWNWGQTKFVGEVYFLNKI
jgi:hypothetical protein